MIRNKFLSFSRRFLPIVAVILVFMSVVMPVNAAHYGDNIPICTTLYTAADARVVIVFNDDMRLIVDMPDVFQTGKFYDVSFGTMEYRFLATEDLSVNYGGEYGGFSKVDFSLIPFITKEWQVPIKQMDIVLDDFTLSYENQNFWSDYFRCQTYSDFSVMVQFNYCYVDDGIVKTGSYFRDHYSYVNDTAPLLDEDFFDELAVKGVEPGSYVHFYNATLTYIPSAGFSDNVYDLYFSTCCKSQPEYHGDLRLPDAAQFVLDNGIIFNKIINNGNVVASHVDFTALSDFIASGVSSFMDAPILSSWLTLGDVFGLLFGVILLMAVLKILKK